MYKKICIDASCTHITVTSGSKVVGPGRKQLSRTLSRRVLSFLPEALTRVAVFEAAENIGALPSPNINLQAGITCKAGTVGRDVDCWC